MKIGASLLASVLLCITKDNGAEGWITSISPEELESGMQSGLYGAVIDVRTLQEFEAGHIPNATLVESLASAGGVNEITNASRLAGCEQCNIAVYCASGARSSRAAFYLQRSGFQNIFDAGGIGDWHRANKPIVTTASQDAPCLVREEATCATPPATPSLGEVREIGIDELGLSIQNGFFRAIVDVRTLTEFEAGHIPNATLVESLGRAGTALEVTNSSALAGCEQCNIAVYCRSGARAREAANYLRLEGFQNIYEAGGINDWIRANKPVVTTTSIKAPCTLEPEYGCKEARAVPSKKDPDEDDGDETSKMFQESKGGAGRGGLGRHLRLKGS